MQNASFSVDQWPELRAQLPAGFDLEATARTRGAFMRARGIKDAETLLRMALAYGACGMSLRESCAWAEASGLATLSDPALLKRLCNAEAWLGDLLGALVADQAALPSRDWAGYCLRAIDATTICAPGADRATWRLHLSYDLTAGQVDDVELSDGRGAESLNRFAFGPGDIALGDRGYARPRDLRPVLAAGADLIVRMGWNSLRLLRPDGSPLDLFAALAGLAGQEGEISVHVDEGEAVSGQPVPDRPLALRLVMRRKSREDAEAAQRRLRKDAKKRGKKPDPRSIEAAKYILLLSSLPADRFPAADVLALYRLRWQVELAFKRMKGLAGLDTLPAKRPELARAWIYGRLIAALLAERLAGQVPDSPPSAPRVFARKPVALAPHEDGARSHPRRRSRHAALAPHRQRNRGPATVPA